MDGLCWFHGWLTAGACWLWWRGDGGNSGSTNPLDNCSFLFPDNATLIVNVSSSGAGGTAGICGLYNFVPPSTGTCTVTVSSTLGKDPDLVVADNTGFNDLIGISENSGTADEIVTFSCTSGVTYFALVFGKGVDVSWLITVTHVSS